MTEKHFDGQMITPEEIAECVFRCRKAGIEVLDVLPLAGNLYAEGMRQIICRLDPLDSLRAAAKDVGRSEARETAAISAFLALIARILLSVGYIAGLMCVGKTGHPWLALVLGLLAGLMLLSMEFPISVGSAE